MRKVLKQLALGAGFGAGVGASVLATADTQLLYQTDAPPFVMTSQQASELQSWVKGSGAWDGDAANVTAVSYSLRGDSHVLWVSGIKQAPEADIPAGSKILGEAK